MKRRLTQLNLAKNLNPTKFGIIKTHHTLKLPVFIFWSFCLMMCFSFAQAQGNDCPNGDPLEWDWIQNLLANNSCENDPIIIKYIHQFEYNGSNHFRVYQGPCDDYLADGDSNTYYDCQGNVVCTSEFFNSDCDQEIYTASSNSTTIWRYEYNCTDPFELYKVQAAIQNNCTDAIYAFDYEGDPYLYFKKGCDYFDEIYNCKTKFTCSKVSNNFDGGCDTLKDGIQPLINESTAIWTNTCIYEATGTVEDTDDCGYLIHIENDISPMEASIDKDEFTLQDGQTIEFTYTISQADPFCFIVADITCIRLVSETCGCKTWSIYPVCGVDGNTYDNACLATCQGVEIAYNEACIPCYDEDPLQAGWIKEMIANGEGCTVYEIRQFQYNGNTHFEVRPNAACVSDLWISYYDCISNPICNSSILLDEMSCNPELLEAANSATTIWTYNEIGCANPLDTDFAQEWINNGCAAESIYSFEYDGDNFIYVKPNETCDIFYEDYYYNGNYGEWNNLYNCNTSIACIPFHWDDDQNCYNISESFFEEVLNDDNLIWRKPCDYELTGEVIQYEDFEYGYGNCEGLVILMESEPYQGYVYSYILYPEIMPGDFVLQEGQIVELSYRSINVRITCDYAESAEIICIREAGNIRSAMDFIECPQNQTASICAPVNMSPPLNIEDFSTTDDPDYMNSMQIEMDEQIEVDKYFTTFNRVYTISDEAGNQKTCETKHHIADQFLQMPEVSGASSICEEDLWSHIKIGVDQYKIYADNNGIKGAVMSICNTPGVICSTTDLGVDTKLPGKHNFWVSTYFEFPDGSVCESEAVPFYVDVQAKPLAELSTSNQKLNIGEGIFLMDLVSTNKSGYWSGENISYLTTVTGENVAYFSSNNPGVNKLYYTVKNDFCKRKYLLIVEVASVGKVTQSDLVQKTKHTSFNIYPNPTSNKVFIDLQGELIYHISLTNISGKVIKQLETNTGNTIVEMNVDDLPKGIYLLELKNAQDHHIQKLIIE